MTNDFYYLTIKSKPIIHKQETCTALVETIKSAIGVIQNKIMCGVHDDIPGWTLCYQTAYLLAEKQSNLILMKKLGKVYNKLNEIIKIVGLTTKDSVCGDFIFGTFTNSQIQCIKRELTRSLGRR